jgi:hypothetical protein
MMASPDIVSFTEQNAVDDGAAAHCTRLVAVYTAVMASSRNEGNAFNAAVQTYRSENPDALEEEARRAVAEIICRKP